MPLSRFSFRLAPEDVSDALTGFEHNAVTPFGLKTAGIPVRGVMCCGGRLRWMGLWVGTVLSVPVGRSIDGLPDRGTGQWESSADAGRPCFCMITSVRPHIHAHTQIVLSEATLSVQPRFLYMGGGHVNCKLGWVTRRFVHSHYRSRASPCGVMALGHTEVSLLAYPFTTIPFPTQRQVHAARLRAGAGPDRRERVRPAVMHAPCGEETVLIAKFRMNRA